MRNRTLTIAIGIAAVVLAVLSYKIADLRGVAQRAALQVELSKKQREIVDLQQRLLQLKQGSFAAKETGSSDGIVADNNLATGAAASPLLERLRVLMDFKNRKLGAISIPLYEKDGHLSKSIISLFDLNASEAENVQRTIAKAKLEIEQYAGAKAYVSAVDSKAITITIPPYEGGPDSYDRLITSLGDTLGDERLNIFLAFESGELSKLLNSFGAEQRRLLITKISGSSGTEYQVDDDRDRGSTAFSSLKVSRFPDVKSLSEKYGWVDQFVPQLSQLSPQEPAPHEKAQGTTLRLKRPTITK